MLAPLCTNGNEFPNLEQSLPLELAGLLDDLQFSVASLTQAFRVVRLGWYREKESLGCTRWLSTGRCGDLLIGNQNGNVGDPREHSLSILVGPARGQ